MEEKTDRKVVREDCYPTNIHNVMVFPLTAGTQCCNPHVFLEFSVASLWCDKFQVSKSYSDEISVQIARFVSNVRLLFTLFCGLVVEVFPAGITLGIDE